MKTFRPIRDKGQLLAICAALNKLFWKTASGGRAADEQTDDRAEYWVGELLDRDIDIAWNREAQRFQRRRAQRPNAGAVPRRNDVGTSHLLGLPGSGD